MFPSQSGQATIQQKQISVELEDVGYTILARGYSYSTPESV